jgi:hypothetical protein
VVCSEHQVGPGEYLPVSLLRQPYAYDLFAFIVLASSCICQLINSLAGGGASRPIFTWEYILMTRVTIKVSLAGEIRRTAIPQAGRTSSSTISSPGSGLQDAAPAPGATTCRES